MATILITSSVKVSAPYTLLRNEEERIKLTLEALKKWIEIAPTHKIIICDGSNYNFTNDCKKKIPKNNIEFLYFENNTSLVREYGKGYGEGEIVKFALENSLFLRHEDFFIKCSARIWVENFRKILISWNGIFECDLGLKRNKLRVPIIPYYVDTKFYIVNKSFYLKHFLNNYKNVRDKEWNFLEHEFFKSLLNLGDKVGPYLISQKPTILGVSGTYDKKYKTSKFYILKKQLTHFVKSYIIKAYY
jgi:hypothetical protein